MLRVSQKIIFISDNNNFGQGNFLFRSIKQIINFLGLWRLFDLVRTKGKGYHYSEGDGIYYSYSVFNNYKQIEKLCNNIYIINTKKSKINLYQTASHIALCGIKRQ